MDDVLCPPSPNSSVDLSCSVGVVDLSLSCYENSSSRYCPCNLISTPCRLAHMWVVTAPNQSHTWRLCPVCGILSPSFFCFCKSDIPSVESATCSNIQDLYFQIKSLLEPSPMSCLSESGGVSDLASADIRVCQSRHGSLRVAQCAADC